jgi:DnaJ-class molecular chaperone
MATALEILGLPPESTVEEIKARWKALASEHHPDRGGDAAKFSEFRQAYTKALELASKPRRCEVCNGTGKRDHKEAWSFHSIKLRCEVCRGTGKIS